MVYYFIFQHLKKKNRVKLVEYFIDVAKECINIGNFNSLMAIIAGMNMNPVARLKKTVSTYTCCLKQFLHLFKHIGIHDIVKSFYYYMYFN